jgi:DNA processing protein
VFAIPGSIHNPLAKGCHGLIRQGAKLVENGGDILEEITPLLGAAATAALHAVNNDAATEPVTPLDEMHLTLLESIGYDPLTVDELIEKSRLTPAAVCSMLLLLELQGYVESLPGNRTCRTSLNPPGKL